MVDDLLPETVARGGLFILMQIKRLPPIRPSRLIYRNDGPLRDHYARPIQRAPERAMTTQIKPYPIVERVIDIFGNWLKHRQELREIRELDDGQFSRIAQELCVTPADLEAMVRQGPHAADELPRLLKALGIDRTALSRTQPFMLRDMERVCTLCQQKPQCDHDLDAGTSAHHYEEYCPNAPTIDALGHKP